MNEPLFVGSFQSHLVKKHALRRQIDHITGEYRRQKRKHRHAMLLRNLLISCFQIFVDGPMNVYPRATRSFPKSQEWWDMVVPLMNAKQFKESFRMQRGTYQQLVDQLRPYLQKENTVLRFSIPVEKRIGCALYLLGSTCELRTAAHLFGIGKSTAAYILHDFCEVLVHLHFTRVIKFPSTLQEIELTTNAFLENHGYPMCLGAVDGTHIRIQAPIGAETDYFNFKKYHSVIMLAVVDAHLKFTYVNVGAPGRCNDASVYSRSTLMEILQLPIYAQHNLNINNTIIQPHLIGDSAFPLSKTLMKPYPERTRPPPDQSLFNYRLSHCRCTVEQSFGSLKNRFRCLYKKLEYDIDNSKTIIKALCILHNICVDARDSIEIEWDTIEPVHKKPLCNIQMGGAAGVREALSVFFSQNPL